MESKTYPIPQTRHCPPFGFCLEAKHQSFVPAGIEDQSPGRPKKQNGQN